MCSSADTLKVVDQAEKLRELLEAIDLKADGDAGGAVAGSSKDVSKFAEMSVEEVKAKLDDIYPAFKQLMREAFNEGKATEVTASLYWQWAKPYHKMCERLDWIKKHPIKHQKEIRDQKHKIEQLSEPLQKLIRQHCNQRPMDTQAKNEAITAGAGTDAVKEILQAATVYTTIKPGHERWEPIIKTKNGEYLAAGAQLTPMLTEESLLPGKVENHRKRSNWFLKKWRGQSNKFDSMRAELAEFGKEIEVLEDRAEDDKDYQFVGRALAGLEKVDELSAKNPEKGYMWAFREVIKEMRDFMAQAEGEPTVDREEVAEEAPVDRKGKAKAMD